MKAPIDAAAVERALAPFGHSRTLPAEAYTSPELFEWERRHFLEGSWVCVGRMDDVRDPGAQRGVQAGAEGVLLVRGADGVLRAFSNVCRHRGHQLLESGECTVNKAIVCPYHAWTYGLDGGLRGAPSFRDAGSIDTSEFPLVGLLVAEWLGWVFVNATGTAPPFAEHVGNLAEEVLGPYEPGRLVVAATHEYEVEANWKLIAENYHECYHCSNIHPALCKVTPVESGLDYVPTGVWAGGNMELFDFAQTMSFDGASGGVPLRGLDEAKRREVQYCHLFPNLLISAHPDYVMTHRLTQLAPGRTAIECQWLFPPEALELEGFSPSYAVDFWDVTNREDWGACESVQRGATYRGFRPGPLSARESTVYQAITIVARGYRDGHLSPPAVSSARLMDQAAAGSS
jgi:Rieske 2Fe-2S family protein